MLYAARLCVNKRQSEIDRQTKQVISRLENQTSLSQ